MKKAFFFISVFLISITLISCRNSPEKKLSPEAVKGTIDLTQWNLKEEAPVSLKGEWEFYPNQLLTEADFTGTGQTLKPEYITVPGTWNDFAPEGKKFGGSGYGTYRLRVMLKNPGEPLAVKPGAILTAYRLYVNGKLLSSRGVVGTSRETSVPLLLTDTAVYEGTDTSLDVILQISNFHHRLGGTWDKVELGLLSFITARDQSARDVDFFIFGALLVIGLFYFSMFLSRKNDPSYLYFSLFCVSIALRMTLQSGVGYLNHVLPFLSWEVINKLEYITMYTALPFFTLFTLAFFRDRFLRLLSKPLIAVSGLFTLITVVTTSVFHSWLIPAYQIVLLVTGSYILVVMIKNFRRDVFARILLLGTGFLFATVVNDIMYSNGYITSAFLVSYGLLIFILFQALVLMIRFIDVFHSVERQKRQLIKTNQEFKEELDKRVQIETDLKAMNEHLLLAKSAIILGLAKIAEYRDSDTGSHLSRIQEFNRILALELVNHPKYADYITVEYINDLYESSILHDIGKVGVPDSILLKPGKLTPEEFDMIKKHPGIGGDTILSIEKNIHAQTFLTLGREIAYMHHEKWDGTGYPNGFQGERIPLSARITALSDVYDALTTKRCYKDAFSHEKAVEIIEGERGKQFDPDIVDAFLAVKEEFLRLGDILRDMEGVVEEWKGA